MWKKSWQNCFLQTNENTGFFCGRHDHFPRQCRYRQTEFYGREFRGRGGRGRRFRDKYQCHCYLLRQQASLILRQDIHCLIWIEKTEMLTRHRQIGESTNNMLHSRFKLLQPALNCKNIVSLFIQSFKAILQLIFSSELHRQSIWIQEAHPLQLTLPQPIFFYHLNSSIVLSEHTDELKVQRVSGSPFVFGKGKFNSLSYDDIILDAYVAMRLATHILSVRVLTCRYNVFLLWIQKLTATRTPVSSPNVAVVLKTDLRNGLHAVPVTEKDKPWDCDKEA